MNQLVVAPDLETERQTAIFVMRHFVPEEQHAKVDLEFIMQQLRRSTITPPEKPQNQESTSADATMDNNNTSEDWQDLMQWNNPSLLDNIESRQVHLFQWHRTYKYLTDLYNGLQGMVAVNNMSKLEWQRKEINKFIQIIRGMRSRVDHQNQRCNDNKRMNVCWILWKLRGLLATIPTPTSKAANGTAYVRIRKFHEELGIVYFYKLIQWLVKNPDQYLLYIATVCWFPEPPHSTQNEAQDRKRKVCH